MIPYNFNTPETKFAETHVLIEFSMDCGYIDKVYFQKLDEHYDHIIGKLVNMIHNPKTWLLVKHAEGKQ